MLGKMFFQMEYRLSWHKGKIKKRKKKYMPCQRVFQGEGVKQSMNFTAKMPALTRGLLVKAS